MGKSKSSSKRNRVIVVDGDTITLDKDGRHIKRVESRKHKQARAYFERFDIEKSKHNVPKRVCLLGPGVNAANEDAYKRITADFIVAINCAIVVPQCKTINWPSDKSISGWFIAEYDAGAIPWYQEMFRAIKVTRYFSTNTCVGGVNVPPQWATSIDLHTFTLGRRRLFKPLDTPLGIAVSVMAFCGAEYIELCGFDISGSEYYNHTFRDARFNPEYIRNLEYRIAMLRSTGIDIVSLNTVNLKEVRMYNESRTP